MKHRNDSTLAPLPYDYEEGDQHFTTDEVHDLDTNEEDKVFNDLLDSFEQFTKHPDYGKQMEAEFEQNANEEAEEDRCFRIARWDKFKESL